MEENKNEDIKIELEDTEVKLEASDVSETEGHHSSHQHHHHYSHHSHHHSHHHHSNGHHSSSKKRSKRKSSSGRSKASKKRRLYRILAYVSIVVLVAFLFVITAVLSYERGYAKKQSDAINSFDTTDLHNNGEYHEYLAYFGSPLFEKDIDLLKKPAREYIDSDLSVTIGEIRADYKGKVERCDIGSAVTLTFDTLYLPDDLIVASASLEISDNKSFTDSAVYDLNRNYSIELLNLKTGTEYYYNAIFALTNGKSVTVGGQFNTQSGPRMMNIDGIFNVRDIGGWKNIDGMSINQGLLYRGTEVDGAVEANYKLTDRGVKQLVMGLGVKYDMDLRASSDSVPGTYIMGANITHKYYETGMYGEVFTNDGKVKLKAVFSDLAKPENYPMYLHCTYGCDRTGTVCYILGAILGMSEDDLIRDYELSGLFSDSVTKENIQIVYDELQAFDGETIREKATNYLLSIGVTYNEIESIRSIFLNK